MINIYTDGSATKNRSGWGWIAYDEKGRCNYYYGQERGATNQRMELMAALKGLEFWDTFFSDKHDVTVYTDSAYLYNCYTDKWWINWENNGWVNSKGDPVANKDLWKNLIKFFQNPQVKFEKVKGHSGHTYNELADKLATGCFNEDDLDNILTYDEINDKINIELSEILLDYSMKKYPVNETIKRIREACSRGQYNSSTNS